MAARTLYTASSPSPDTGTTPRPLRRCADCGAALDTSKTPNARYCARDRDRRRALTFLGQALPHAVNIDEGFAELIRRAMRHGTGLAS